MDASNINPADLGPESGFEEFLASFLPPDQQKKKAPAVSEEVNEQVPEEKPEETTEEVEETSDESPEETETEEGDSEEAEETPEKKYAEDGVFVKIKVGDKEHEVAVKDLQRLYGQEAALTQKSQTVAEERKKVEAEVAKNVAATNALLERAKARFEPYSKIDFLLAAQKLSPEEYTALRNEAVKAYEDVQFLEQGLNGLMTQINTANQTSLRERAAATLKELQDPEKGIQGFDEKMYDEMRTYAKSTFAVPAEVVDNIVDGWALRILHKAMLYDKGQKVAKDKTVVTKVNKTPKKVVKSTTTPEASKRTPSSDKSAAAKRHAQLGTEESAAAAFLAGWADE